MITHNTADPNDGSRFGTANRMASLMPERKQFANVTNAGSLKNCWGVESWAIGLKSVSRKFAIETRAEEELRRRGPMILPKVREAGDA